MNNSAVTSLTTHEVPLLLPEQLKKFTAKTIHAERVLDLDPATVIERLAGKEGQRVIGADFGGDKGSALLFKLVGGRLVIDEAFSDYVQGDLGTGYLECLERIAAFAVAQNIPVGLSWGAPLNRTRPLFHPKLATFLEALNGTYGGDFANVLPTMASCTNDGPAGLISGTIEASRTRDVASVLFPINGGGLGLASLTNNTIYSTEAGHVEGVPALNTYKQSEPCGVYGASYVCIERLGSNKAGIEAQWAARHGYLRAVDIEARYKAGDTFARELYDHSALVLAHMIVGSADALQADLTDAATVIVGHGGAFKFPDYGKRVQQIIAKHIGAEPWLFTTYAYSNHPSNACIEGAALTALLA